MKIKISYLLSIVIFMPNINGIPENQEKDNSDKYKEVNNLGKKLIKFIVAVEEILFKSDMYIGFKGPQKLMIADELENIKNHFKALEKYEKNEALQDWFHSLQSFCQYFFESSIIFIVGSQKNVKEKVEEVCRLGKYVDIDVKEVIKSKFERAFEELILRVAKTFGLSELVLPNKENQEKGSSEIKILKKQGGITSEELVFQTNAATRTESAKVSMMRKDYIDDTNENVSTSNHTEVKSSLSNNETREDMQIHNETNEDSYYTKDGFGINGELVKVSVPEENVEEVLVTLNLTKEDDLEMRNITYQDESAVQNLTNEGSLVVPKLENSTVLGEPEIDESTTNNDNEEHVLNEIQETLTLLNEV